MEQDVIPFEQARQIVAAAIPEGWTIGTYTVAPWGYQDAESWLVIDGAREWLDGDEDYADMSGTVTMVDKETGAVERLPYLPNIDRVDAMMPCGEGEPEAVE